MDAPASVLRPTSGQRALADALARGEAAMGTQIIELDASVYTNPQRFAAEQRAVFGKLPLVVS